MLQIRSHLSLMHTCGLYALSIASMPCQADARQTSEKLRTRYIIAGHAVPQTVPHTPSILQSYSKRCPERANKESRAASTSAAILTDSRRRSRLLSLH